MKKTNRLANQTSPYLREHATNPVDWYPWGDEALQVAKEKNKSVLLSIGYSACHWCHVMARESFEDEKTAALMNKLYVNIKVDREERPDLDDYYQKVAHIMGVQGGWPLTVFLTPDLKPIFIGTYFPKERRFGMPSFREILIGVERIYREKQDKIQEIQQTIDSVMMEMVSPEPGEITVDILSSALIPVMSLYDYANCGFGTSPKFPSYPLLSYLLSVSSILGRKDVMEAILGTLNAMARGGIYDHIGGGFHRYSVDAEWRIPHFEKMLYDNALLAILYLKAFMVTEKKHLLQVAEETLRYLEREMKHPEGGYFSSQNAETEGEEGKYYVWSKEELVKLLDEEEELLSKAYGVTSGGNFNGKNVLYRYMDDDELAKEFDISKKEVVMRLEKSRRILYDYRKSRHILEKDEKIIVSWNGMVMEALFLAGGVTGNQRYVNLAFEVLNFIFKKMFIDGEFRHVYLEEPGNTQAFLEDYAFLVSGILEGYRTTGRVDLLEKAVELADRIIDELYDEDISAFTTSPEGLPPLFDGAIPSPNFVMAKNLLKIYYLTGREDLLDIGEKILKAYIGKAQKNPTSFASLFESVALYLNPVVVAITEGKGMEKLASIARKEFEAYMVAVETNSPLLDELFRDKKRISERALAYVCMGQKCLSPCDTPTGLVNTLRDLWGR